MCADRKFLGLFLVLAANAKYFCPYCYCSKELIADFGGKFSLTQLKLTATLLIFEGDRLGCRARKTSGLGAGDVENRCVILGEGGGDQIYVVELRW